MVTQVDGVGIVAVQAMQVTALQKDDRSIAGTIHETLPQDMVDPAVLIGGCLVIMQSAAVNELIHIQNDVREIKLQGALANYWLGTRSL